MIDMPGFLLLCVLTPSAGAAVLLAASSWGATFARVAALLTTLLTLAMTLILVSGFLLADLGASSYATFDQDWLSAIASLDVRFHLALDGVSLWLFALSSLLMVTCVLVSWSAIQDRPALFYAMLLLLQSGCLGVFAARDIILFYIFFEFTLIPLFFLIGIWGSEQRRYAAVKFFLYTLAGSLLTFLGLLTIVLWHYWRVDPTQVTFSIPQLTAGLQHAPMPLSWQIWVFLALFAGFAIKVPLFPLHTWLPLAHVQAPTAGSVILAGILLKIGTYGFVRFSIPMLPAATASCMPWLLWLSVVGIIYGALVALAQSDVKRLIAYSSVSHLGFCTLGLFALNALSTQGALLQMINHGLSTGGLFAIVGMLYERYHTREIGQLGGVARATPVLAFFMLIFTFASIGLPGMNGFVGEIMVLLGTFQRAWTPGSEVLPGQLRWAAALAMAGIVLGAWYMLWLVQRVFFGPLRTPSASPVADLSAREVAALFPLALLIFWIGLFPQHFLRPMQAPLQALTRDAQSLVDARVWAAQPLRLDQGPPAEGSADFRGQDRHGVSGERFAPRRTASGGPAAGSPARIQGGPPDAMPVVFFSAVDPPALKGVPCR